ncbi:carbon catabolite repressor protein 4 homolog 6 isoform X2 [Henckelia pumila]|uniref:carbon catabolite repressor protein 4 homolog 6 isoform X2 n=1 Tax=Henckelia pumila TaxID=405737 RepID=UPI003C6DF774
MKRHPHFHYIAAAATTADSGVIPMYYAPPFRRWRSQGGRGYSDIPPGSATGVHPEVISGDSHFHSVQDANRGFRSLNPSSQQSFNGVPLAPQYYAAQQFYGNSPQQQFPGRGPYADHNQRSYRPPQWLPRPPFGNNQQFKGQEGHQQFRPRASKPPDYRAWDYAKPGPPPNCGRFTVLSYNILADYLALDHWQLYSHIPQYILDWSWRKRSISFELGLWSADILCFQEVDRFQDIEAELKLRGYSGIWKMRTSNAVDGCATFWRVTRFKLLHEESIEYNKLGLRDNVAQICVLEFVNGKTTNNDLSAPSTGLEKSDSVVVCNIHVLFNPKRGDIKLGQIRVLLERAQAVSKLWDNAPIVICGDFNCTPKSPLYNFVSERKLDLSELPRDEVSGQVSAETTPSRSSYHDFRAQSAHDSAQAFVANPEKPEQAGFSSDMSYLSYVNDSNSESPEASHSISNCSLVDETSRFCISENLMTESANQLTCMGTSHATASLESGFEDIHAEATDSTHNDNENASSTLRISSSQNCVESNFLKLHESQDDQNKNSVVSDGHSGYDIQVEATGALSSDVSQINQPHDSLSPKFLNVPSPEIEATISSVSAANDNRENLSTCMSTSYESTNPDFLLDKKSENFSLNDVNGTKDNESCADINSFLSELHNTGHAPSASDLNSDSHNQTLDSCCDGNLNNSLDANNEVVIDSGRYSYVSSAWTPMEMQTATGSTDCNVVEHPLKLRSAYAEVQGPSGLRDPSGEPLVTSYHRRFLGTVDYIWISEDLEVSKVLAPIPKHVMLQTRGFPTKKWGSDHIALVSELAFTKDEVS